MTVRASCPLGLLPKKRGEAVTVVTAGVVLAAVEVAVAGKVSQIKFRQRKLLKNRPIL